MKHCIDFSTCIQHQFTHTMAIKITMYVIKANYHCLLHFILSSFICQNSSFTYLLPNFPAVICWQLVYRCPSSIGIGYDSPIPNTTQYWKILGNTQYPNANIVLTPSVEFLYFHFHISNCTLVSKMFDKQNPKTLHANILLLYTGRTSEKSP